MSAVSIPLRYASRGSSLPLAALAGQKVFHTMVHHPRRDVVDRSSGTRFFYHAHNIAGEMLPEHGHFHLFHEGQGRFSHLAALSLDAGGRPLRWFCTNQWVTGEHWRAAARWSATIRGFQLGTKGRLAPVAQWLQAMVALYADELIALLHERDALLKLKVKTARERQLFFNDRRIHILCSQPIFLQDKVQSLL